MLDPAQLHAMACQVAGMRTTIAQRLPATPLETAYDRRLNRAQAFLALAADELTRAALLADEEQPLLIAEPAEVRR